MKSAAWLFGGASALAGILDLIWREFEPAHQPIQAWSDHIPGITFLAVAAGLWLAFAGIALFVPRTAPAGAAALTILYAIFTLFPLPRLVSAPHYLGDHVGVYIGVFVGVGQQLVLLAGAACLWMWLRGDSVAMPRTVTAARWVAGLSCLDFGLGHFISLQATAAMIPTWMPLGGVFWTVASGIGFLLGGLGLLTGVADRLAAGLVGVMLLLFSLLVLTPRALAAPHSHVAWGGDAYNLTAVGAFWILSACLAVSAEPAGQWAPATAAP